MLRKWLSLAVTFAAVGGLVAGLAVAADEEGPVHEIMEKINRDSNAIKKATRTAVAYKKAQASKEIVTTTEKLLELAKESRGLGKEAVKKTKNLADAEKKWLTHSDAFIKELEKFHETAGKPDTNQAAAKSAWGLVNQTCTNCHNDFRVEDDKF